MAKSLRASRNKTNKTLKRKSVFGEAENARSLRLAEKLHKHTSEETLKKAAVSEDPAAHPVDTDTMDTDRKVTISALNKKRKLAKLAKKAKKDKHKKRK